MVIEVAESRRTHCWVARSVGVRELRSVDSYTHNEHR